MPTRSLLWKYFSEIKTENGTYTECNVKDICGKICGKRYVYTEGTTSGMKKHLGKHPVEYEEYLLAQADKDRGKMTSNKRQSDEQLPKGLPCLKQPKLDYFSNSNLAERQQLFDDSVVKFVSETGISFNVLGSDSFKYLINVANRTNGKLVVKDPRTYSRKVGTVSRKIMSDVCDIMAAVRTNLTSVGFTTDLWTPRANDSYVSLTASFIDKYFTLHRWTPYIKPFPHRHQGVTISIGLDSMIEGLGFHQGEIDLFSVNDNAANMKVAIKESKYLKQYLCDIHTLQLAVTDTFSSVPGMKAVLDKSKSIAAFTKQSPLAISQLRNKCKEAKIAYKKPINPGDTRWSSQYDNMNSILPLRDPITWLCNNIPEWEGRNLTASEWRLLSGAVEILKPVKETIKILEAEKIPTINRVIERIYTNQSLLASFIANESNVRNKCGIGFARELSKRIEERFPNKGMNISERRFANYLDPRYRGLHLQAGGVLDLTMKEIEAANEEDNLTTIEGGNKSVSSTSGSSSVPLSPTSKLRSQIKTRTEIISEGRESKIKKEIVKYESFSIPGKECDVLSWWKRH